MSSEHAIKDIKMIASYYYTQAYTRRIDLYIAEFYCCNLTAILASWAARQQMKAAKDCEAYKYIIILYILGFVLHKRLSHM